MEAVQNKNSLKSLQVVRAGAIILVVLHHVYNLLLNYHNIDSPIFSPFKYGDMGVDLFFVLSGFIIFYVHQKDFGNKSIFKRYAYKRITRIIPLYWMVTVVFLCFVMFDRSIIHIINSFLLIPSSEQPVVGVAWSLQHELLFYLIFGLLILNKKIFMPFVVIWTMLMLITFIFSIEFSNAMLALIFSPLNLEFLFGCAVAYIYMKKPFADLSILALIGSIYIMGMWIYQMFTNVEINHVISWGIPAALLILGLVNLEEKGKFSAPKLLVYLGDASYSIYLIHVTIILIFEKLMIRIGLYEFPLVIQLIAVVASIASITGGCLLYNIVEKPSQRFFRSKLSNISGKKSKPSIAR
ncbi:acyltransferase family protein [Terribacillus saccharophilus]|uniref:acyltransferase family protein n=1 Tax=Terribacillus saccharophilus TaxID=361277 RepID=UPI003821C926